MSHVVITGASSGIGKSIAYTFAAKGHNLVLTARRVGVLEEIKQDIEATHGVQVDVLGADLSVVENAGTLYEDLSGYEITALINNAGFGNFNMLWDVEIPRMMNMIDLNIKSLSTLSMLFTKDYKDNDAQLINVASVGGYMTMPSAATYVATKFYVSAFTESLAQELKAVGSPMKAKILAPGPVETEFIDQANKTAKQEMDGSGFTFHSADQMADFTYQLFESDDVVGIVDMSDMSFNTRDVIHPAFVL